MGVTEVQDCCQVRRKLAGMLQVKMPVCVKMLEGRSVQTVLGSLLRQLEAAAVLLDTQPHSLRGRKKRRDSHRECRAEARSGHNRVQKPEPVLLPPVSPGPHLARSPQKANREESSLGDLPFNPTIQPAHHP